MGLGFPQRGTEQQKLALERRNVQRIVFVPVIMAIAAIVGVFTLHKSNDFFGNLLIAMAFYAVVSVAFSCFAFQLIRRRSRKSELWLFQMLYMIANAGFLTYISYAFWEHTGSVDVYVMAVLSVAVVMLYRKEEYVLCGVIEGILPLMLCLEGKLLPQQGVLIAVVHILSAVVAFALGKGYRDAEEYRRKYIKEVKMAETDPLTKVNNRRGMMRRVMSVWPALEKANRSVAVLVIDIDHFKKYNDRFGHPAGDACLCRVAEMIRQTVKGVPSLVSRIGGEEFLVFLHGLSEEQIYGLAEQIRRNVEGLGIAHAEEARYRNVTVSIGAVTDRCSGEISFGGLYRRADRELYRAKSSGRNRVMYSSGILSVREERRVNMR